MTDVRAVTFTSGLTVDPRLDALTELDKKYVPRIEINKREWERFSPWRCVTADADTFKDGETLVTAKLVDEIIEDGEKKSSRDEIIYERHKP
ncbi:amidase [Penicillium diatomitis]|uniref:Amidase n=1 Tax=Penicillium diatomitis TaxID=2819901 RepID=A0A9W9X5A1_9EURO|nr:amidase [Penicillium diatomitis]KAJ5483973.1 amidase [Penicillium diatomitis]